MIDEFEKIKIEAALPEGWAELRDSFAKDRKIGIYEIANYLINKYSFLNVPGKIEELYLYSGGIYTAEGATKLITETVRGILAENFNVFNLTSVIAHVKAATYYQGARESFGMVDEAGNSYDNLLCINNGILDVLTGELTPHSPKQIFLSKLPLTYKPEADCPNIKKFISSIFEPDDTHLVAEWIGYLLYRKYIFKKALLLLGARDSGKTTFLNLLSAFLGEGNYCSHSLQSLCMTQDFVLKDLYQRYLNAGDDLDFSKGIQQAGQFKSLTGNAKQTVKVKFKENLTFTSFAKLMFTANQVPAVKGEGDLAYYSRWLVLECNNRFIRGGSDYDPNILEKITTEEELSGLLNWALEGLARLMKNQGFSYKLSDEETKMLMESSACNISGYVQDRCEKVVGAWASKDDLYADYVAYVEANKLEPVIRKELFGKKLLRYANYATHERRGPKGGQKTGWGNIALKPSTTENGYQIN